MEQVKTNWLQKAVAVVAGIVLAACLAAGFAPAKAWAGVDDSDTIITIDSVTITGYQTPVAGGSCDANAANLGYKYPVSLSPDDIQYERASWCKASDGNASTTFEAGESYYLKIEIMLTSTVSSPYAFDSGFNSGDVHLSGLGIESAEVDCSQPRSTLDMLDIKTQSVTVSGEPSSNYKMISGDGATWAKGSTESLVFVSEAPFAEFCDIVVVDDEQVDSKYWTAVEGSTKVTLSSDFLQTLELGQHDISIVSEEGVAQGTFTVKEAAAAEESTSTGANTTTTSPKTGVETAPLAVTTLVFALGALAAGAFILRTRKEGVK